MCKSQSPSNSLILVAAAGVLACLGPTSAACGQVSEPSQNLARNLSFEQAASNSAIPAEWHGTPQVYSLDIGVARTGKASLKYVNQDPQRYVLCTQKAPVQAGWKCRVSAWIKTQDIAGDEAGATICLEWQGKDGKWLGGVYPTGIKGTRDWTRVGRSSSSNGHRLVRWPEALRPQCFVDEHRRLLGDEPDNAQPEGNGKSVHLYEIAEAQAGPVLSFVPEMERLPGMDVAQNASQWSDAEKAPFDEPIRLATAGWMKQVPAIKAQLTPERVRSLSRWAKVQMEGYTTVPDLDKLVFQPQGTDANHRRLLLEGTLDTLPSHAPLVTRWLKVYLMYDLPSRSLSQIVITIRGQRLE